MGKNGARWLILKRSQVLYMFFVRANDNGTRYQFCT